MNIFGLIFAVASLIIGFQDVDQSRIAQDFGPGWYHARNFLVGYGLGFGLGLFLQRVIGVISMVGAFIWWLILAIIPLALIGTILLWRFYSACSFGDFVAPQHL